MTAPVRHFPVRSLVSGPVVTGIAAASGAMLILWLLFGHRPDRPNEKAPVLANQAAMPAEPTASAPPSVPASAPMSVAIAPAPAVRPPSAVSVVTRAAAPIPLTIASAPSAAAPSPKKSSASASRKAAVTAQAQARPREAATKQVARAVPARNAQKKRRKPDPYQMADVPVQKHANRANAERTLPLRITRAPERTHSDEQHIAAVESAWRSRMASSQKDRTQPPKPQEAMSPEALYSILQHSPTLDSNAPASGAGKSRAGSASAN